MPTEPDIMADDRRFHITIARQLGSGGSYLAQRLAHRLGSVYLDHQILEQAARQMDPGRRCAAAPGRRPRGREHMNRFEAFRNHRSRMPMPVRGFGDMA
jgi:hypothetical protein